MRGQSTSLTKRLCIRPTSCRCGGSWAYVVLTQAGAERMIGCVCHTCLWEAEVEVLLDWRGPSHDAR